MTTSKKRAKPTKAWAAYLPNGQIFTQDSGPTVWRLREDAVYDAMGTPGAFVCRIAITEVKP